MKRYLIRCPVISGYCFRQFYILWSLTVLDNVQISTKRLMRRVLLVSQFCCGIFSRKWLYLCFFVATSVKISYQFYETPTFLDSICNKIGECAVYMFLYFRTQITLYLQQRNHGGYGGTGMVCERQNIWVWDLKYSKY